MSVSTKCEHAYKGCTYRIQIQKLHLLIRAALSLIWPKTWLAADLQFRLPEVRHAADRRTCDQQFLSRRSIRLGYRPFFLSRSQSLIGKESGKYLTLTHSRCPGSLIFLRLLQTTSPERSLPVAYRAQHVGVTAEGHQQFRLKQVQPNCDSIDKEE